MSVRAQMKNETQKRLTLKKEPISRPNQSAEGSRMAYEPGEERPGRKTYSTNEKNEK